MKVFREWRISGDTDWMRGHFYPEGSKQPEYCIRTWDPDEIGALTEPQHNTYDPVVVLGTHNGMLTSFYLGALKSCCHYGRNPWEDVARYRAPAGGGTAVHESELYNGEYFYQRIIWEGLRARQSHRKSTASTPITLQGGSGDSQKLRT